MEKKYFKEKNSIVLLIANSFFLLLTVLKDYWDQRLNSKMTVKDGIGKFTILQIGDKNYFDEK